MRVIAYAGSAENEEKVNVTQREWCMFKAAFDGVEDDDMIISIDDPKIKASSFEWVRDWLRSTVSVAQIDKKEDYESIAILADRLSLERLLNDLEMWYLANIASPRNVALFLKDEDENMARFLTHRARRRISEHLSDLQPADDYLFAIEHGLETVSDELEGLIGHDLNGRDDDNAKTAFLTRLVRHEPYISGRLILDIFTQE